MAANDVHFLSREDHEAHDVMICIGTGKLVIDENRMHYSPEVYFKTAGGNARPLRRTSRRPATPPSRSPSAATSNSSSTPPARKNTRSSSTPDGSPREEYLRTLCHEGLVDALRRGTGRATPELSERLEYEIDTINELGFASYFLITADFIKWARDHDIPVGPGRGSAAGSLVAYAMGITDICPMRFGLLFERFLNPERVSPPDVDIDFCQSRRAGGDRVRPPEIRRALRLPHHHLRHPGREERDPRRRPRDGRVLRRGGPHRQDDRAQAAA